VLVDPADALAAAAELLDEAMTDHIDF